MMDYRHVQDNTRARQVVINDFGMQLLRLPDGLQCMATHFAQEAQCRHLHLRIARHHDAPQRLHQLLFHGFQLFVQVVVGHIVDAQLQSAQTLRRRGRWALHGGQNGRRQQADVRHQCAQSHRNNQTELDENFLQVWEKKLPFFP